MNDASIEATLLILFVVVVAAPIVAERFRFPGMIGLIAGGMIVGPFMLGWVGFDGLLKQMGDFGLLYLMFLAGLSFNIRAFFQNRTIAIFYGLLGFVLPFALSIWVAVSISDLGILAAALIGAMWASNTLVAYPDVLAAGLQNNRAVSAAVSAGVVADLLSLTVLAVASSTAVIDLEGDAVMQAATEDVTLPVYIGLPVLIAFCLWILPKIADWFFVRVGHTRVQRFVFTLAGMAGGAYIATLGGIEGLIGAFLAGLGMNRLVPARSGLMDRLDFVGSSLFIPAFLVSIGLSINPAVLFDIDTVVLALLFTGLVVVGKTSAAVITGLSFKVTFAEIGLMSALSYGQAASTLAIAQVGISLGFFGQDIVNAAVLTIVTTALITSFGTRFFVRKVGLPPKSEASLGDVVLVDVRPLGSSIEHVMNLAGTIARADDGLVVPYAIPDSGMKSEAQTLIAEAVAAAAAHGLDSSGEVRIDSSFADGTVRLVEQEDASLVVLAWEGVRFPSDFVFGNEIDRIGARNSVPTAAVRMIGPAERIIVAPGDMATEWQIEDAKLAMTTARRSARQAEMELIIASDHESEILEHFGDRPSERVISPKLLRGDGLASLRPHDLLVMSAHALAGSRALGQWRLSRAFREVSLIVIAGPRRLSVSSSVGRTAVRSFVGPTIEATPTPMG